MSEVVTRQSAPGRARWLAFALVCTAYLATTVGEQLLSPLFPVASDDLGLDLTQGGIAFGVLTASIAVANLVGGFAIGRVRLVTLIRGASLVTAAGAVIAATANGFAQLLCAQVVLGAGAGLFFPAGLQAVSQLAGARKGFAMGLYGVAFSAGLTVAAVLGALGASQGWRVAFWTGAALGVIAAVASAGLGELTATRSARGTLEWRAVLFGLPTQVGSIGAVCQYGAIPFLTTYAVDRWSLAEASAALVLAAGRVISIVAKVVAGHSADRVGPRASVRRTGLVLVVTGLVWVVLPGSWPIYVAAAVFAGTVSSVFPVANLLALEQFGSHGLALGIYRSAQIGVGALAGFVIGLAGNAFGLRPVLTVAVAVPALLWWACRQPHDRPV